MQEIINLFTTEDIAVMRESMREIVVKRFEEDMESLGVYLFDEGIVNEMIHEMYQDALSECKSKVKDILMSKLMAKIGE